MPSIVAGWSQMITITYSNTRVCIDFRNLNVATPKDEYPIRMAEMLVDSVADCEKIYESASFF